MDVDEIEVASLGGQSYCSGSGKRRKQSKPQRVSANGDDDDDDDDNIVSSNVDLAIDHSPSQLNAVISKRRLSKRGWSYSTNFISCPF